MKDEKPCLNAFVRLSFIIGATTDSQNNSQNASLSLMQKFHSIIFFRHNEIFDKRKFKVEMHSSLKSLFWSSLVFSIIFSHSISSCDVPKRF